MPGVQVRRRPDTVPRPPRRLTGAAPAALLAALLSALYAAGLHPGVAEGDAAELQWAGSVLGLCHSPGYPLQVTVTKLFTRLPLGGGAAWRTNVMSALFGVIGALALYASVRRVTRRSLAAWVAAATLGLSSVYWSHALIAETYVFGAAFLMLALYGAVRWREERSAGWLALSCLCLGVVVAERPSEALVVPAFAGLWIGSGESRPGVRRWLPAAGLFLVPFALAFALVIARGDPARPAAADEVLRDGIPGIRLQGELTYEYGAGPGLGRRARAALAFMSGAKWTHRLGAAHVGENLRRYAWLVSGLGVWGDRFAPEGNDPMLRGGTSVALPGLLLAAAGAVLRRREIGLVLFGAGLVAGNLLFVLPYYAFDSMTFTVPGVAGLSFLTGLGCAGPPGGEARRPRAWQAVCLLLPLGLLLANFGHVSRDTPATRAQVAARGRLARAPWPPRSVLLSTYWPAMTYRYLLRVESPRTDVAVLHVQSGEHLKAADYFLREGRPVFVSIGTLGGQAEAALRPETPRYFLELGFVQMPARGAAADQVDPR